MWEVLILGAFLWGISTDEAVIRLNDSVLEDKGVLYNGIGANKTPLEVIKEGALGGTCFRGIDFSVTGKWYRKSWKELDQVKDSIIVQIIMMSVSINMVLNAEHC